MAPSRLHISAASEGLQGDRLLAAELCCPPRMGLCDAAVPWASGLTGPWEWAGAWPGVGARMAHALGVRAGEMVVLAPPSLLCSFVREAPGTGAQQACGGGACPGTRTRGARGPDPGEAACRTGWEGAVLSILLHTRGHGDPPPRGPLHRSHPRGGQGRAGVQAALRPTRFPPRDGIQGPGLAHPVPGGPNSLPRPLNPASEVP